MSPSPELDRAQLSVLLDVRHPLAYLALHPALAFAAAEGIAVDWLPLSVPTLKPPGSAHPDDDRGTRHRRYRAQAIAREVEVYAAAQGLELGEIYRSGGAEAANLGWLWVRDRHPEQLPSYLTALFRRYWALELDVSSQAQIAALLDSLGAGGGDYRDWCRGAGPSAATAVADALQSRGLFQVPAYLVEDEVFYGRQHLPMIRWILRGRAGPIPI